MANYYKFLGRNGEAYHGGSGRWPLPDGEKPGEWLEVKGEIVPCSNGLHLCNAEDICVWTAPELYKVEYEGNLALSKLKVVVSKARLVKKIELWNDDTAMEWGKQCINEWSKAWSYPSNEVLASDLLDYLEGGIKKCPYYFKQSDWEMYLFYNYIDNTEDIYDRTNHSLKMMMCSLRDSLSQEAGLLLFSNLLLRLVGEL